MITVLAYIFAGSLFLAQLYFFLRTRNAAAQLRDLFPPQDPIATILREGSIVEHRPHESLQPQTATDDSSKFAELEEEQAVFTSNDHPSDGDGDAMASKTLEDLPPTIPSNEFVQPLPAGTLPGATSPTPQLMVTEAYTDGFRAILNGINTYLDRNRAMPVTFLVLQDIVERTTDSYERAASLTQTLPLYIGLMGTFIGVILGLFGLSAGQNASMEDADLRHFLTGIVVAMFNSLMGLLLFVIGRSKVARAQAWVGFRKRDFFILLQSELLPAAGQEVAMALYSLQANLSQFNEEFRINLRIFNTAMEAPANTLQQQREMLQALEKTDLKRIVEANATTMKAITTAAPVLEQFLTATHKFVDDLQMARDLSNKLHMLLDRVVRFEEGVNVLGTRFREDSFSSESFVQSISAHLEALDSRKKLVQQFVAVEEDALRQHLQAQELAVGDLFTAARQSIGLAGDELQRSIAASVGSGQTNELLANIALLKEIAQRSEAAQKSLAAIAARRDSTRTEELLAQMLSALQAQANRTFLPPFLQKFVLGKKGSENSNAGQ